MRGLLAGCSVLCGAMIGGTMMLQNSLLYFPEEAALHEVVSANLAAWPASSDFRGLIAEPNGTVRGTIVVFHGNAGHAGQREFYARTLTRLGLRVILAEYPGYGPRAGSLGEQSLVADAQKTIELAHRRYGIPLLVVGESLGAGVAAAACAHQQDRVAGLLLVTPWDRLENVARHHYPRLPVKWLLRDRYDSVTNLASFTRNTVVAVAEQDAVVPARFGTALHDTLRAPRQLKIIPGAGHNDWFVRVDEAWWRQIVAFLLGDATGK